MLRLHLLIFSLAILAQTAHSQNQPQQPAHPQTPKPPFPYHSDSVEYDNADKTVHLGATLTYPEKGGPFAAAILITGSGTQDRDETIFGQHPFAVIADYLTRKGYAVLRVDDRGAGLSTGDTKKATSADFVKDVETSLDWLKRQKQIDPKRIGLIGHSEGGMIAPMLASQDKTIAFIISLAGPVNGDSTTMFQVRAALQRYHASEGYIGYALTQERLIIDNVKTSADTASLMHALDRDYRTYYATIPDSTRQANSFIIRPDNYTHTIASQVLPAFGPWWKFFIAYDATPYYSKVKCPVLLLGGAKDIHVDNATDMPRLAAILKENNNKNVEIHLFPDLNHLFQHCQKCTVQEYGQLEETFAPEALKVMADWLDKILSRPPSAASAR